MPYATAFQSVKNVVKGLGKHGDTCTMALRTGVECPTCRTDRAWDLKHYKKADDINEYSHLLSSPRAEHQQLPGLGNSVRKPLASASLPRMKKQYGAVAIRPLALVRERKSILIVAPGRNGLRPSTPISRGIVKAKTVFRSSTGTNEFSRI